ncbi:glycosyltransferase [bacterium]|nr:glycosyltransferase [bacterium]
MTKKVFIIITKGEVGGAQMSVLNLARGLKEKGLKVKVGFGEGNFLKNELDKLDIEHIRFKHLKRTHNPFSNLFFIWEIKKYFDKNRYDTVHINSSNALLSAIGAKLSKSKPRIVFTFRGMSMLDENYQKNPVLKSLYRFFFKFLLKFIDKPVFVSRENLEKGEKSGLVKKGYLVYNGLNPSVLKFYTEEESKKRLGDLLKIDLENKFIIGSIGRLAYQKNYEFLINIFSDILKIKPNSIAIIIGEGDERYKYEKLIKEKDLEKKVLLAGNIDNASKYLKAFDLFVLPSRYEGLSITLIETLFAGIPVLAKNVGGNQETLPSASEIYRLDDKEDFIERFKELTLKDMQEKIMKQNFENSKNFLLKKTLEEYIKIYS